MNTLSQHRFTGHPVPTDSLDSTTYINHDSMGGDHLDSIGHGEILGLGCIKSLKRAMADLKEKNPQTKNFSKRVYF